MTINQSYFKCYFNWPTFHVQYFRAIKEGLILSCRIAHGQLREQRKLHLTCAPEWPQSYD